MAIAEALQRWNDKVAAYVLGEDPTPQPGNAGGADEPEEQACRSNFRSIVVWVAIIAGVLWVFSDLFLIPGGALSPMTESYSLSTEVVYDPSTPDYVLTNARLQEVAEADGLANQGGGTPPQCACVSRQESSSVPQAVIAVEGFGSMRSHDPALMCPNNTLKTLFVPNQFYMDLMVAFKVPQLLESAVRHYCLLIVQNPLVTIVPRGSVMLSRSQWNATQYSAISSECTPSAPAHLLLPVECAVFLLTKGCGQLNPHQMLRAASSHLVCQLAAVLPCFARRTSTDLLAPCLHATTRATHRRAELVAACNVQSSLLSNLDSICQFGSTHSYLAPPASHHPPLSPPADQVTWRTCTTLRSASTCQQHRLLTHLIHS